MGTESNARPMRYLIVGCGRVGLTLAKLLVANKHDVVVVDENPAAFKRLGTRFGGEVEVGTGIDYDVLKRAAPSVPTASWPSPTATTARDGGADRAADVPHPEDLRAIYDPPRGQLYRDLGIETFCRPRRRAVIRDRLQDVSYASGPSFDFGNSRRWSPRVATKTASASPTSRSTARFASRRSGGWAASASPLPATCSPKATSSTRSSRPRRCRTSRRRSRRRGRKRG